MTLRALDLFAGTGWGVAAQRLGIHEEGVDNMEAVVATRACHGMPTIYRDVWDGLLSPFPMYEPYDILVGSPPCQSFSRLGNQKGLAALGQVLDLIIHDAYRDPIYLAEMTAEMDPRTALVLTPLAHVWRDRPTYVALEQVEAVLPVWEAYAHVMRGMGYSVWTGYLHSEQYGVPQSRKRAYLIARRDGITAMPPAPTHSRYYPRDPARLDPDVLPWVSMAEGLGIEDVRAWVDERVNAQTDTPFDPLWITKRPALTIAGRGLVPHPGATANRHNGSTKSRNDGLRITPADAARLQSYPEGFEFQGSLERQYEQAGNAVPPLLAQAVLSIFL